MAREIVARSRRPDIPVYRGTGCGGERCANEATVALTQALNEGPLTILALGPLTTIAATLGMRDAPTGNVEEIVFVGGRRDGLEFLATPTQGTAFRDMNFECDPAAASELLALGVPLTLAGWEVSSNSWLTPRDLDRLRDEGGECARWLAASARTWQSDWQRNFAAQGFTPFDTLAVGWMLLPDAFARHLWPTRISHDGHRPLFVADPSFDGPTVTYLREVDHIRFHADLMLRLLSG